MNKAKIWKQLNICFTAFCMLIVGVLSVHASDEYQYVHVTDIPESDGETYEVASMDENGNITMIRQPEIDTQQVEEDREPYISSYDVILKWGNEEQVIDSFEKESDAQNKVMKRNRMRSVGTTEVRAVHDYSGIKYGVVDFHTKPSNTNTNYTETQTNAKGYLNGSYASDGAFLGYCSVDKSKIKFRQAGVEGCVSANDVIVRDYEDESMVKSVNFYKVVNGSILHYITLDVTQSIYASTINIGPAQSYMKNNGIYYSYDGHYFYTTYKKMIDDYKNGTYKNSINPNQPYYNYFQYITHRTKTSITANQLDAYLNTKIGNRQSIMKNLGKYFIQYQDKYGANGLLMFALACNESAYGTSSIALTKNNLFGHNATDTDPGGNADRYSSPQASIEVHAKDYVSNGYLDPKDYAGRYHGGHLGDKGSGMNVSYASDSYWGEKAASIAWAVTKANGNKEFGKYQIGIIDKMTDLNVRKEANTVSNSLYKTGNSDHYSVMILSQTSGQDVNGNKTWYKIQTDPTLNADRTAMTQDVSVYDYNKYYGYVSAEYVDVVKYSNMNTQIPNENQPPVTQIMIGDVNGDKRISAADYVMVKNHILKIKLLNGDSAKAADVNKDGKISSADYVMIKNHILGIQLLK